MKRTSDWLIALAVIACSAALLAALSIALTGNPFATPDRTLRVRLPDITGLQPSSLVKYAGASAGTILEVRVLTPAERLADPDPANAIELTLAISPSLPELNEGTTASISANTLLADKFILLAAGDPAAPVLTNDAVIPGTAPTTIDSLVRTIDRSLRSLDGLLPTGTDGVPALLAELRDILTAAHTLIDQAGGTLTGADGLVTSAEKTLGGANQLIDGATTTLATADTTLRESRTLLTGDSNSARTLLADLTSTADELDSLATRAQRLLTTNTDNIDATLADLRVTSANLKVTATYAKALAFALTDRPQQIIWGPGRKQIKVPTEQEILSADKPTPLR